MDESQKITIFTDGAARGNPGPGGYAAVIIFPESNDVSGEFKVESLKFQVVELGGREEHTTNNRMELAAAIKALEFLNQHPPARSRATSFPKEELVSSDSPFPKGSTAFLGGEGFSPLAKGVPPHCGARGRNVEIFTDSRYLVNGITKWIHGWQKNGWQTAGKKEVENRDLWEMLAELTPVAESATADSLRGAARKKIEWRHIGGHIGIAGNHRCDEIATAFADGKNPNLYHGPLAGYPIKNILDISFDEQKEKQRSDSRFRAKAKAYSYVSMVDGVIQTHKTWGLCEQRVKGKSGARFKKATSAEEEKEIIKSWIV